MSKQHAKLFCAGITALVITACVLSACGGSQQTAQESSTLVKTKNAALVTRTNMTTTTIALPPGCYKTSDMFSTLICPPADSQRYVRPSKPMYLTSSAYEGLSCSMQWNAISASNPAMVPGKNAQGQTDDFVCWLSARLEPGQMVNPVWYRESTLMRAAQAR